jgi:hypothetical protein
MILIQYLPYINYGIIYHLQPLKDAGTPQISDDQWHNCSLLMEFVLLSLEQSSARESSPFFGGEDIVTCTRLCFCSMVPFFYEDDKY